jgi:exodeoxyribonuclease-3
MNLLWSLGTSRITLVYFTVSNRRAAKSVMAKLKIATYNVNGIRGRLPRLLEWLERESPDIVCLQELKSADHGFPAQEIQGAGYGAVWVGQKSWNGVAILAKGIDPVEVRRSLPGDPKDEQGRYIEAAVDGLLVACLYLPNGNPQPGPKFEYKLAWFERLIRHAALLCASGHPVILAGDYNVVPTDFDIYNPKSWLKDALLQPESRECYRRLLEQGWTDAIRTLHVDERIYTFWDYFRQHWQRNSGLRIDHLLLNAPLRKRLSAAGVDKWVRGRPGASDHAPTWIVLDAARTPVARKRASPSGEVVRAHAKRKPQKPSR